jgi:hypothetical protein
MTVGHVHQPKRAATSRPDHDEQGEQVQSSLGQADAKAKSLGLKRHAGVVPKNKGVGHGDDVLSRQVEHHRTVPVSQVYDRLSARANLFMSDGRRVSDRWTAGGEAWRSRC